jgi:hypothetical protein
MRSIDRLVNACHVPDLAEIPLPSAGGLTRDEFVSELIRALQDAEAAANTPKPPDALAADAHQKLQFDFPVRLDHSPARAAFSSLHLHHLQMKPSIPHAIPLSHSHFSHLAVGVG